MRSLTIAVLISILAQITACPPLFASEGYEEAERMATEIHEKVGTDVIYTEQEIKALYYQNIQVITLLREIRDLLRRQADAKDE